MERTAFNENWLFSPEWHESLIGMPQNKASGRLQEVRLPHSDCMLPFNSFDQNAYQKVCGYVRYFEIPEEMRNKRIFIRFDGAAHQAEVWCNGKTVGSHKNGYTAFRLELTDFVKVDEMNQLCVKVDSREQDVPPFGGFVDYLTYGGLYRDVWFETSEQSRICDVFIRGEADGSFRCSVTHEKNSKEYLRLRILDSRGSVVYSADIKSKDGSLSDTVKEVQSWLLDNPVLYTAEVILDDGNKVIDREEIRFGFRTAEFKKDGFYLNGEKVLIRGLDRHQSWPYMGYAAPARAQRLDADILKNELGCNGVRTSHYPQSQHFISRCDEIGLLVFMEMPGWQHIGNDKWQAQAVQNVREMVSQYRNHPSIILWGVRINESSDNDEFYQETNRAAHELDDSRPTGGVRNFRGSHLLEDVYTYNDFSHVGTNSGCEPKDAITSDSEKPYLITEYMGHIFPTKSFDDEEHRKEHAMRHARVLNDIAAQGDIAGGFGWCMFDYNTHREFGSGDGICYHGVMDMFRNPKLAASVYASQSDIRPVLGVSSSMDIGEWPAFGLVNAVAFTNADEVRVYRNGEYVRTFYPAKKEFPALPHPPVFLDDLIGAQLKNLEGYDVETAKDLKKVIYAFVRYAQEPFTEEVMAAKKRLNDAGISDKTIVDLQNRYMTGWGRGGAPSWRILAIKNGGVIAAHTLTPGRKFSLCVEADTRELIDGDSWDMATVRISVRDENGNVQTYCQRALELKAYGSIELIGPEIIPLSGGMAGCYVRTRKVPGRGFLNVRANGMDMANIIFHVRVE